MFAHGYALARLRRKTFLHLRNFLSAVSLVATSSLIIWMEAEL